MAETGSNPQPVKMILLKFDAFVHSATSAQQTKPLICGHASAEHLEQAVPCVQYKFCVQNQMSRLTN